jgi:hypothetical protein
MIMDAKTLVDTLDKYKDFKREFPDTAETIIFTLRNLINENDALRRQLKSACNALMEKTL